ncbi:MAG: DUF4397 domain-containing protein [candidate division Zixibacteria bacterium]|nr:DUF4397 domain-containing protein [candidate division Zixibacteria bacterium]
MKSLRKIGLVLLSALGLLLAGCEEEDTSTDTDVEIGYSELRVIHAAPSAGEIDFRIDDLSYEGIYNAIAQDAAYGDQYGYYDAISYIRTFRIYEPNTDIVVAESQFEIYVDHKYTVIATDLEATLNPDLTLLEDTTDVPTGDTVLVRFLHASADTPSVNILKADDSPVVSGIERHFASPYIELPAATYTFKATASDGGELVLQFDPVTFLAGNCYTIILSGTTGSLSGPEINATIYQETSLDE